MIPKVGLVLFSLAIISTVTIHFGKALAAPITHFKMSGHVNLMMTGVSSYTFNAKAAYRWMHSSVLSRQGRYAQTCRKVAMAWP